MKVPISNKECCGCSACVGICPTSSISMKVDSEGFLYPYIDEQNCINCQKCAKMCAFANYTKKNASHDNAICYVAKHNDCNIRMNSRSGGLFVSFSDWIIANGGVVYGCVLNEDLEAVHTRATSYEERNRMCRSKYVQSNTENIFSQIKFDLDNNMMVLFSGTGCQADALYAFLKQTKTSIDLLYTVDIVCHGCVSPMIFSDYIRYLEKKYNGKVSNFEFRDKTVSGWEGHTESFVINGKKHKSVAYREIFYSNLSLRPSCYNCKYASTNRPSDITIADAWGIKQALPEFNDNRGVSLVMVNSDKGRRLWNMVLESCEAEELPLSKMLQPNLKAPTSVNGDRSKFWNDYKTNGIYYIIKKYGAVSKKTRIKVFIKYKIKKLIFGRKYYLP